MLVDLTAIKQLLLPRFCLPSGPDLLECLFKSESSRPKYLSAACMQKVKSQYAIKGLAKGTKEADGDGGDGGGDRHQGSRYRRRALVAENFRGSKLEVV